MSFMVMYTVYGEAIGKQRPRFVRRGNHVSTYTPEKTRPMKMKLGTWRELQWVLHRL